MSARVDPPGSLGPGAASRTARAAIVSLLAVALLAAALVGCGTTGGARAGERGFVQEGRASYYSRVFDGRRTASGERYDPERLTAAHPALPLGTWIRVTRTDGRFVDVRVNDRCGCGGGHIVDLSRAAARRLDMIRAGTIPVRVEVLGK